MAEGLGGNPTRLGIRKILLLAAISYFGVRAIWAFIERLDRHHWSAAMFYLYPVIVYLIFLAVFWKLPDPKQLQAQTRDSLRKGLTPEIHKSRLMLVPFALAIGLFIEYAAYRIASDADPHHADRNILIDLCAAITLAGCCFLLTRWLVDRGRRTSSQGLRVRGEPAEMGIIRILRDAKAWRDDGAYKIEIDGSNVGSLRRGRHRDIAVPSGQHRLRITKGWRGSANVRIPVEKDTIQVWECGPTPPDEPSKPEETRYIRLRSASDLAPPSDAVH